MLLRICHRIFVLLLLLTTTTPAQARTYILVWSSDWPIVAETVTVEVVGGELRDIIVAPDGKSGQVDAVADLECVTIHWSAQTEAGFPVAMTRGWYGDCPRLYLPMVVQDGE